MKITIHKGRHSPNILQRLLQIGIFCNKKKMERIVEFDITCKYDHPGTDDDEDVNKLFGWAYLKGLGKDSIRFGWNWNNDSSKVRLYAYYYVNGERGFQKICEVPLNFKFLLSIERIEKSYQLKVLDGKQTYIQYGSVDVTFTHNKSWGYTLGCFFGGNNTAPHDITFKISRK